MIPDTWARISEQDFHDRATFDYEMKYVQSMFSEENIRAKANLIRTITRTDNTISTIIHKIPQGPVVVSTPPNTGFTMASNAFIDLYLSGIPMIFKPSLTAAATTLELLLHFRNALDRLGGVRSAVNTLIGDSVTIIAQLAASEEIAGLIHIGGDHAGRAIQQEYADSGKVIALEMQGSDLICFLDDLSESAFIARMRRAIQERIHGAAGQFCVGPKRFLIPLQYLELAKREARAAIAKAQPGLMCEGQTTLSPVADPDTLFNQIARYKKMKGVDVVVDGYRVDYRGYTCKEGDFITPFLITIENPGQNAIFMKEELFGPGIQIGIYDALDEIPMILDNSNYNLRASIHGEDADSLQYLINNCRTGGLFINRPHLDAYGGYVAGGRGFSCESSDTGARFFAKPFLKLVSERIVVLPNSLRKVLNVRQPEETLNNGTTSLGNVILTCQETSLTVNHGYQTPNRVKSYLATQENLVVPKQPFFDRILQEIDNRFSLISDNLRIFEPGFGPALFARQLLESSFLSYHPRIHIEGADISYGFLYYSASLLNRIYDRNKTHNSHFSCHLSSGVNCINEFDPYYDRGSNADRFHLILASQFEHYCPNSTRSTQGIRYRRAGIPFSTKREFRQMCYSKLKDGGIYCTIDDRRGETPEEQEILDNAWDEYVARQYCNPNITSRIQNLDPSIHNKIINRVKLHTDKRGKVCLDSLIKDIRNTRNHRRAMCCEEIEPLSATLKDFREIFGRNNVIYVPHPYTRSHSNFYLIIGIR